VAEAYVAVFCARLTLDVAETHVARLHANAHGVTVILDGESVPTADRLAATVALSNADRQRLRAAHGLRLAQAAYNRQVGQPLDRVVELAEPAAMASASAGEPREPMTVRAPELRPEFTSVAAERKAIEPQAPAQVAVRAGYSQFKSEILDRQNFVTVGVAMQWRLFDSDQVAARTSALHGRARAVEQRIADFRLAVSLELETALLNRDDAAARVRAASGAVEQAQGNLRNTREMYGTGLATNTQVLEAKSLRVTALTNRDNVRCDLLLSGHQIPRAVGDQ